MSSKPKITADELQKHSRSDSCWLLLNGAVWDFTEFASKHPGGINVIYKYGGGDASDEYNKIHGPSLVSKTLGETGKVGEFDNTSPGANGIREAALMAQTKEERKEDERVPLRSIMSTYDFDESASKALTQKAWAFFSSGATDLVTMNANIAFLQRIWLRPQILKNVSVVSTGSSMLGVDLSLPLFASPVAMAKLAHVDGELAVSKGCAKTGTPQILSTNSSFSWSDISAAATNPLFCQLYVNKDRRASEKLLQEAERCGMRGVFVTVDQPTPAKREADERIKAEAFTLPSGPSSFNDSKGGGLGRVMGGFIDASFNWGDIKWLRQATTMPIVLKGVSTTIDAMRAVEHGIDGIIIGNHGGRSLDTSTPSILSLLELRKTCPSIFDRIEVYFDGGIRRGTDVFKALCLGARAVGMGRHFLYAANYGSEGVEHLIEIIRDEFETTMKMMGCTDISQLHPGLLNTRDLDHMVPEATSGLPDLQNRMRGSKL